MVELMVALLLGILLTGGTIQVFVSNRATYAFNEGFARLQENGRFALDTLSYHARLAGYLGCLSDVPRYNNLNTPTTLPFNFEEGLGGYEAIGTNPGADFRGRGARSGELDGRGRLDAGAARRSGRQRDPGQRRARRCGTRARARTRCLSPFTSATVVTAVADVDDYSRGDIAIVSDCQKASIFQITSVAATRPGGIELRHVAAGTPGNQTPSWNTDQEYAAGAQLVRGETWVFYVGARARRRPAGAVPAALAHRRCDDDAPRSLPKSSSRPRRRCKCATASTPHSTARSIRT